MIAPLYRPLNDRYDEWVDAEGRPRAHWRALYAHLQGESEQRIAHRQQQIARQIQDNGVTYNVYADPRGADRPWALDSLPQIIAASEWSLIAQGLEQRAELLNRILLDLYSEQRLLAEGLLPAELVYGHSHFLWPAHGIAVPGNTHLHVYAADLARDPEGRWRVLADRAQTPSGAGYALENRIILGPTYHDLPTKLGVQSIEGCFLKLRDHLLQLAPTSDEPPLLVLLTPGVLNETYFEHAFLANQMGIPLAQGDDLTVRDRTLFLKTAGGLQRVHAVLRRIDGGWCDPLELRSSSALGVPGLLDAARAGRVLVANSLGSGVVESPALMGFLPAIAKRLLGEELRLSSLVTWWCGEAPVAKDALQRLDQLVLKPSFPLQRFEPVFVGDLNPQQQRAVRARINRRGYAYVAQERIKLSQTPVLLGDSQSTLAPRAMVLRAFVLATAEGYRVIPGGLTRVASDTAAEDVSMQRGGRSKDTWVLGEPQPVAAVAVAARAPLSTPIRRDRFLLSRSLESLFWFGRYCERCETQARVLRSLLQMHDLDRHSVLEGAQNIAADLLMLCSEASEAAILEAIVSRQSPHSLAQNLDYLHSSAMQIRAYVSKDNWRAVRELRNLNQPINEGMSADAAFERLNRITIALAAMSGFALGGMTREPGWRFLMVGRQIEQLQQHTALLKRALADNHSDADLLGWLLELGRSAITYRRRYVAAPECAAVLDLLVVEGENPYALSNQIEQLIAMLSAIDNEDRSLPLWHRALSEIKALDFFADRNAVIQLLRLTGELHQQLKASADQLGHRHFAHVASQGRVTQFA